MNFNKKFFIRTWLRAACWAVLVAFSCNQVILVSPDPGISVIRHEKLAPRQGLAQHTRLVAVEEVGDSPMGISDIIKKTVRRLSDGVQSWFLKIIVATLVLTILLTNIETARAAKPNIYPSATYSGEEFRLMVNVLPSEREGSLETTQRIEKDHLTTEQRLGLLGLTAIGGYLSNKRGGDMTDFLVADILTSSALGAFGSWRHDHDAIDGALYGGLGGLLMFDGKLLAMGQFDHPGFVWLGRAIHTGGVSIRDNVTKGRSPLSRFELDIGPVLLGVNTQSSPLIDFALLPDSLFATSLFWAMGGRLDLPMTLKTGMLTFEVDLSNFIFMEGSGFSGGTKANVIGIDTNYFVDDPGKYAESWNQWQEELRSDIHAHEFIHGLQYAEMGILGTPAQNWAGDPKGLRFDRAYGWPLFALTALFEKEHDKQFPEREPEAWEKHREREKNKGLTMQTTFGTAIAFLIGAQIAPFFLTPLLIGLSFVAFGYGIWLNRTLFSNFLMSLRYVLRYLFNSFLSTAEPPFSESPRTTTLDVQSGTPAEIGHIITSPVEQFL